MLSGNGLQKIGDTSRIVQLVATRNFTIGKQCYMLRNHNVEPEHAEDIPQPEVVVFLLGKLLLAQCIQDVELPREVGEPLIAHRAQLHLHDDFSIWDHHRHRSEQDLNVFGASHGENVVINAL